MMHPAFLAWSPGMGELVLILVIVLIIFGAGRIGKIMKEFGSGISQFKKGIREGDEEAKADDKSRGEPPKPNPN